MIRQSINLVFVLVLLVGAGGMRYWPAQPTVAAEGAGFEWRMLPRHLGTSLVDPNNLAAAQTYVNPSAGYGVSFDGCETLTDEMASDEWVRHTYTITGPALSEPRVVSVSASPEVVQRGEEVYIEEIACEELNAISALPQGAYDVQLRVETSGGEDTTYSPRSVLVRDILIISVGDSYGSGEGAPDRMVQYGLFGVPVKPASWQDERCHRSAWAGASQAAAILERSDPYTSVTFVSLACSGATINTPIHDAEIGFKGAGLLAPYAGVWPKVKNPNPATFLPPQMEQAARIANDRAIDALIISGGGNDMHFGPVITDCVLKDCSTNEDTRRRLKDDFEALPTRYQELAWFITNDRANWPVPEDMPALNITPDRVFLAEYPDPTRDTNGDWCEVSSLDDPLLALPFVGISKAEMEWAHHRLVAPLNQTIRDAAAKHGWNFVSGIAAEYFGDPARGLPGHGWCALGTDANGAPNNWIHRSPDALAIQGPATLPMGLLVAGIAHYTAATVAGVVGLVFVSVTLLPIVVAAALLALLVSGKLLVELKGTDGTMHPNYVGQLVQARHLAASVETRLSGKLPVPGDITPPTIATPQNITVQTRDPHGVVVDYPIPATHDDGDGAGLASCSPASGSLFPIGTTRVICTARDGSGNQADPVSFLVTVEPITIPLPAPRDGQTTLRSICSAAFDANYRDEINEAGPLSFEGPNVTAFAGGQALKASTHTTEEDCLVRVTHQTGVTVEAGDSGLAEGDPVLLQVTLGLDGTFATSTGDHTNAWTWMDAGYTISETECPIVDYDDQCLPLVRFTASGGIQQWGGAPDINPDHWYANGSWSITSNVGEEQGDGAYLDCEAHCTDAVELPFNTGARTVIFGTRVGARLYIAGALKTQVHVWGGDSPSSATSDFADTFAVSVIQPAAGFEGLNLVYDGDSSDNQPPTVDAGGPYSVEEGGSVVVTASGSDPDGDALTYEWDLDNDGMFETAGESVDFSAAALDGPGSQTIGVRVSDANDAEATDTTTVTITNVAPSATPNATSPVDEGGTIIVELTNPSDPSTADLAAGFTYTFDCGDGVGFGAPTSDSSATCAAMNNPSQTVKATITDKDGDTREYETVVTVNNVAPTVGAISAPAGPVLVGAEITVSADVTDPGILDTHTALVDWGDGSTSASMVSGADGSGVASASHTYTAAGLYTVRLEVTDADGGVGQSIYQHVVVYDPHAGFVTGGGWVDSPAGAYTADPSRTGKANISFNAKYDRNASVPTGQAQFTFSKAGLNFHSTGYDWLVVTGARAYLHGSGTINGQGDYGVLVNLVDHARQDAVRIRIWDKGTGTVIYDSQPGAATDAAATTVMGGGSLVIHRNE